MTPQLAQLARYVVKENYDFGFATVDHETYNESELEKALHDNITALLLEMGNGFAFIGKQKEINFLFCADLQGIAILATVLLKLLGYYKQQKTFCTL